MNIVPFSDDISIALSGTGTTKAFDMSSCLGAAFNVVITGAGATGSIKLQGSIKDGKWFDIPATLGGATVTQTIAVGTNLYLNTGNIAFYGLVRVSANETGGGAITNMEVRGIGKG